MGYDCLIGVVLVVVVFGYDLDILKIYVEYYDCDNFYVVRFEILQYGKVVLVVQFCRLEDLKDIVFYSDILSF